MIVKSDVTVQVVELTCDTCGSVLDNPEIVWDNNGTSSLNDDTMSYKYTCTECGTVVTDTIKYPYQEFTKVVV